MADYLIIFGAKYLVFLVCAWGAYIFVRLPSVRRKEMGLFALISLPVAFIVSRLAGWLYYNPRPFVSEHIVPLVTHANTNGFPSDHTLLSAGIAMIVFPFNRKAGCCLYVLAAVVGVSRVLAGVHHLIDIIASLIITILVVWLVCRFVFSMAKKKFLKTTQPVS